MVFLMAQGRMVVVLDLVVVVVMVRVCEIQEQKDKPCWIHNIEHG